ncbi:hypothetical protein F1737_04595 [Methanoplanus sp. FWC-SCC4]|uniref:Uncharacterized protein n=1 Tax=Methanochimaera problematica TaxID=2609417 RepID=A0AA97I2W6_9EURY|nr:hypothetical protein [Methanoplanus sp. FWC-SCC4]WOF16033.1 hypothetical protein F1737_04595 [Methanoplanus sp. FWC-SCC4]
MTKKNYSLCLTIIDQNSYSKLLRIADPVVKSGPTLWQVGRKSKIEDFPEIKTISMDPHSAIDNELGIWEWEFDPEDKTKQWSSRTQELFYELIFLDNDNLNEGLTIPAIDLEDKIDLMISGFKVQNNISSNLLLVFGISEKDYYCFNLKKTDYNLEHNVFKVRDGAIANVHKIQKEHCIDTNDHLKNVPFGAYDVQRRIIYRERKLKEPLEELPIKSFLGLFKCYFEDIGRRMEYNEEQKLLIQNTIDYALKNRENIEYFFKLSTFEENDFIFTHSTMKKFEEASKIIHDYVSKKGVENFLESVIENTPDYKNSYLDILKGDYLIDEKIKIEQNLNDLRSEEKELKNELIVLNTKKEEIYLEYNDYEKIISKYKEEINQLKKQNEQLNQFCKDKFNSIKEYSGKFLGEIAILDSIPKNSISSNSIINVIKSKSIENEDRFSINNKKDLIDELEGNIDNITINHNFSEILSKYIVGCYLSGLPIILIGNTSQLLAETISITFCSKTPDIIHLPTGFNNFENLSISVKSSESNVIVIKNAIGYCDEYLYLNLIRDNPEKFLLFSAEFKDTIRILPSGILGYMGIIDCEEIISPFVFDEILPAIIENIDPPSYDKKIYKNLYKKISELTIYSPITKGYNNSRAKALLSLSEVELDQNRLLEIIIPELIYYNQIQETIDNYIEYLQSFENSAYYEIAKKYCNGD